MQSLFLYSFLQLFVTNKSEINQVTAIHWLERRVINDEWKTDTRNSKWFKYTEMEWNIHDELVKVLYAYPHNAEFDCIFTDVSIIFLI